MKIKFDHAYTPDPQHKFLKRLEKLGFVLVKHTTEHPGKHFCRFIAFLESEKELPVYLEFIHVGRGGDKVGRAGLSLRALGSLEKAVPQLRRAGLHGKFFHKNYDWKISGRERRPGWNFFIFRNLGFRTLFPWITEYEERPKAMRSRIIGIQKHRNSVRRLLALEIDVNSKARRFFARLLGPGDTLQVPGGQKIFLRAANTTRLRAIVLEADSERHLKRFKFDGESEWRGRRARVIRNPSGQWDLFIVVRGS